MEVAIRKARENGVGWVTAKGSNHFGYGIFQVTLLPYENTKCVKQD